MRNQKSNHQILKERVISVEKQLEDAKSQIKNLDQENDFLLNFLDEQSKTITLLENQIKILSEKCGVPFDIPEKTPQSHDVDAPLVYANTINTLQIKNGSGLTYAFGQWL